MMYARVSRGFPLHLSSHQAFTCVPDLCKFAVPCATVFGSLLFGGGGVSVKLNSKAVYIQSGSDGAVWGIS